MVNLLLDVQVLVDNSSSWIVPFAKNLVSQLIEKGCKCSLIHEHKDLKQGDILFLLSCEKIIGQDLLKLHRHNLVVHESELPQGRGWSPLTWQILEGKNRIPVTLIEASEKVDAGVIYHQEYLNLVGDELIDELRFKQGTKTVELALKFVANYGQITFREQVGEASYYPRRSPASSELDMNKTIKEQFNLLRVVDNERYPAFFMLNGKKYLLKIEQAK